MKQALREKVQAWIEGDPEPATQQELRELLARAEQDEGAQQELQERFVAPLEFGTAGLRGVIGAGEHRMNRAVVLRTTLGLADALERLVPDAKARGVVIGYDGRRHSDVFAKDAARVFGARGFKVHLTETVCPTPLVAFAVKELGAAAGVMVTASHNPPEYNGYKVYWENGAQIIAPIDAAIAEAIAAAPSARAVLDSCAEHQGEPLWLGAEIEAKYLAGVAGLRTSSAGDRNLCIVHTALHGVGTKLARQALAEAGFTRVVSVAEQAEPNGDFPTVRFPNPEEKGAMDLAYETAKRAGADLILANDPDADRLSVAIPDGAGGYVQLTGNEVGALLGHYVMTRGPKGKNLVLASIVSSPMLGVMAAALGVRYEETLTGFKWIANRALALSEAEGLSFVFGYEEALGYTVGTLVRDKDGISAAALFAEMTAVLRAEGKSVADAWTELQSTYGVFVSDQLTVVRPGAQGAEQLRALMQGLRAQPPREFAGHEVSVQSDLQDGVRTFYDGRAQEALSTPPSDVLVYQLASGDRIIARPSGTEPKAKIYFDVREPVAAGEPLQPARERATQRLAALRHAVEERLQRGA